MVLTAAILAGGLSRRMGRDKAFIPVKGISLVERTVGVLLEAGLEQIYTVGRQPELKDLWMPTLSESTEAHHPLFGISTVLNRLPDALVLFVPCDLVNLTAEHIRALLEYGSPCTASCAGLTHPLFCVLHKSMASTAQNLAETEKAARCLIDRLPSVELPNPVLVDANRPEQVPR